MVVVNEGNFLEEWTKIFAILNSNYDINDIFVQATVSIAQFY